MRLLLAAILAWLPTAALADVTARYDIDKDALIIEADDGGNSRMELPGVAILIRRDGVDYIIMEAAGGTKVTRFADFLALMAAPRRDEVPAGMFDNVRMVMTPMGETSIGGRAARLWSLAPTAQPNVIKPPRALEIAISVDPALAPIGDIFRRTAEAMLPYFAAFLPHTTRFAPTARMLLAKGTPLRIGNKFELQSVDNADIDHERFELPGPVIPAAEFAAAMEAPSKTVEVQLS